EDLFRKALGPLHALGLDFLREERHEGGIERTFREQPPEQVRKAKRGIEDIRHRPRTESSRHHGFPGEAENPASQRRTANRGELADEAHASALRRGAGCGRLGAGAMIPEGMPLRNSSSCSAIT